jgi:hypothetical protein
MTQKRGIIHPGILPSLADALTSNVVFEVMNKFR